MATTIIYILAGVAAGLFLGWWLGKVFEKTRLTKAKEDTEKILKEVQFKAEEIRRKAELDGKELLYKL